jgi:hypothetical protein
VIQEIIALVIVAAAALYLVERVFGVFARLGLRRAKKAPRVQVGDRLRRGLKNARRS